MINVGIVRKCLSDSKFGTSTKLGVWLFQETSLGHTDVSGRQTTRKAGIISRSGPALATEAMPLEL